MSWLDHRGTLTPATIRAGMRVRVHFEFSDDMTGTVREIEDPWALIEFDGYDGRLVELALIAEMDELK